MSPKEKEAVVKEFEMFLKAYIRDAEIVMGSHGYETIDRELILEKFDAVKKLALGE
jgi:hypothetical protein